MHIEFDSNPVIYWLVGYSLALGLAILLYLAAGKTKQLYERLFLITGAILLVMMRLPVLLFNRELNADESQMITQAMTLFKDPLYWRSVDGTTGGPLGSYFLILPSVLTGVFDYTSAHIGSLILVFITVVSFYLSLRNWFGSISAMAAVYPVILFFSFTQQQDFVHYSSEHMPVCLMALIIFLFSTYAAKTPETTFTPLVSGFLIALLPFGKLQTLPMAAVLVVWGLYIFWERKKLFSEGIWFVSGGIAALGLVAGLLLWANVFDAFIQFYIIGNFQYGGEISWWDNILELPSSLLQAPSLLSFLIPQVLLLLFSTVIFRSKSSKGALLAFPLILLLFTLLAISRTGSGYLHYWLFSVIPVSLFFANYLSYFQSQRKLLLGFGLICLSAVCVVKVTEILQKESINKYPSDSGSNRNIPFTNIARHVLKYGETGEYLVVWGWNCQFYVETQMPQGVAENHSIRSIFKHPMQEVYLERYLQDIKRNKPVVILDAVGKNSLWTQDPSQQLLHYSSLMSYISTEYKLAETVDDTRIYVRKDRLILREHIN